MRDPAIYRQILQQNHWQTDRTLLSPNVADWLLYEGSLTHKLQQRHGKFEVDVIQQGWQKQNILWQRDVWLGSDGQKWIFAQTRIPRKTIENVAQDILAWQNEPIGLWLFKQNIRRVSLEWQQDRQTGCYLRHSVLAIQEFFLEIDEVFLNHFNFK